jgi:glutamate/tyrosine decarboxylase-like PLP-dependent enzyme
MLTLNKDERLATWNRVISRVEEYIDTIADHPCTPTFDPKSLRQLVASSGFSTPMSPVEAIDFVADALWKYQVHAPHPRYYGLFNPAPTTISIAADTLVAAFNPQLATWIHNPLGCEIEQHVIRIIGGKFGYDPNEAYGSFTSGGAEANHTALLTALIHAFPDYAQHGTRGLPGQPVLYTSAEGHHSIMKAARMCGIGTDAVRTVSIDRSFRMIPEELLGQVRRDRADDLFPFMIVPTVGSTNAGVIDPISPITDIAKAESLWLHVDAAWGGGAVLVPELRPYLAGIERADSITFDAHKWLSVPMGAGMYLTCHSGILEKTFALSADYMPTAPSDIQVADPYQQSMQCSRRFIGLKVFLSLLVAGWEGYEKAIRHQTEMGHLLRSGLRASGWSIVNDTPLPLVCFVDDADPDGGSETYLKSIADLIVESGKAWVSTTRIAGSDPVLRACITNHRTQREHIEALVDDLDWARRQVRSLRSA